MSVSDLTIVLKDNKSVYFAGETITGSFIVSIGERLSINRVRLSVTGLGKVYWTDTDGHTAKRRKLKRQSFETYLNQNLVFTKDKLRGEELFLETGDHVYPFEINLPDNIPGSFEHNLARIRYALIGTVDIPWAYDKQIKQVVTVLNNLDLNLYPQLGNPVCVNSIKIYGTLCCKQLPITAEFGIIKGGFVSGEKIRLHTIIDNKSSKVIDKFKITLYQQLKFLATNNQKLIKRAIVSLVLPQAISKNSKKELKNVCLKIPPLSPTCLKSSKVLQISYFLKLTYDIEGPSIDTNLTLPLVIGTKPIKGFTGGSKEGREMVISYAPSTLSGKFEAEKGNESGMEMLASNEQDFDIMYPFFKYKKYREDTRSDSGVGEDKAIDVTEEIEIPSADESDEEEEDEEDKERDESGQIENEDANENAADNETVETDIKVSDLEE